MGKINLKLILVKKMGANEREKSEGELRKRESEEMGKNEEKWNGRKNPPKTQTPLRG